MRLDGWSIEGFGVLAGHEVRGLPPGLSVFLGPNEAGKSTLLAFLRWSLFGFEQGQDREKHYPPLAGGRYGGRVFLDAPGGILTIQRIGTGKTKRQTALNLLRDGAEVPATDLNDLLRGADAALYRSVFAFSLGELQSFDSLTEDGVRDRIFSAGISGAGRSARDAIKKLDKSATDARRLASKLEKEIESLEGRLAEARAAAEQYVPLLGREAELGARAEDMKKGQADLAARGRRLKGLLAAWSPWVELQDATREAASMEVITSFPSEEELDRILGQIENAEEALGPIEAELGLKREELRTKEALADPLLASICDCAEEHHEQLAAHRGRQQDLIALEADLRSLSEEVAAAIPRLGAGWDEGRVRRFDASIPAREEIAALDAALQRAEEQVRIADQDRNAAVRTREDASAEAGRLRKALQTRPKAQAPQLDAADAAVREAREGFRALRSLSDRLASLKVRHQDVEAAMRNQGAEAAWAPPAGSVYWCGGAGGAFLVAATAALIKGQPLAGGALLLVACLAGAATYASTALARRAGLVRARVADWAGQQTRKLGEMEAEWARLDAERRRAQARIVKAAAAIGLKGKQVTEAAIEQVALKVQRLRAELARLEGLGASLTVAEEKERATVSAADERAILAETRGKEARRTEAQWEAWKRDRGLPTGMRPAGALQLLQEIERIRGRLLERKALEKRGAHLRGQLTAWDEVCRSLLARAGAPIQAGTQLADAFLDILRRCREQRDLAVEMNGTRATIRSLETRVGAAREKLDTLAGRRSRILKEAGASDEQGFRVRLAVFRRGQDLQDEIRRAKRRLSETLGGEAAVASYFADLSQGRKEDWDRESAEIAGQEGAISEELETVNRDLGAVRQQRRDLETSVAIAELEQELGQARVAREAAVREWHSATVSQALVEDALRTITRDRQPPVLDEASRTFKDVTRSAYERIVQEEDGESLGILDASGRSKRPEQLSRGTVEQLYIGLRLGLVAEFARRNVALPVVMDDVLVNFDSDRAAAMAGVLGAFAREHQVLMFTCHPETVRLLQATVPEARAFTISPRGCES